MDILVSYITTMKCNNMHVREMLMDRSISRNKHFLSESFEGNKSRTTYPEFTITKNQWFIQNNSKTVNYQECHKMCDNTRTILEFNYILSLPPWILLNCSFQWLSREQDCHLLYRGFISGSEKIWILCSSGKNIILLVRYAYCIKISSCLTF